MRRELLLITMGFGCADRDTRVFVRTVSGETEPDGTTEPVGDDDDDDTTPEPRTTPVDPDPEGPRLTDLEVVADGTELVLTFVAERGAAVMDGGTLIVGYDDAATAHLFPTQIDGWDGTTGTVRLPRPTFGRCALGAVHDLSLELFDRDGRTSGTLALAVATTDHGIVLDEDGDRTTRIGTLGVGDMLCGELDSVTNDTYVATGDLDRFQFSVAANTQARLVLDWEEAGDYDLWLSVDGVTIASSHGPSYAPPEAVARAFSASEDYVVQVDGWAGAPGPWTLTVE